MVGDSCKAVRKEERLIMGVWSLVVAPIIGTYLHEASDILPFFGSCKMQDKLGYQPYLIRAMRLQRYFTTNLSNSLQLLPQKPSSQMTSQHT